MNHIWDGVLGLCIGDALGVPVEFQSRAELDAAPVTNMRGYGSHPVPAGAWSDDSSMALCLLDSLAEHGGEIAPEDIMGRFLSWANDGAYTPYGEMFDIGIATRKALQRFAHGTPAALCGGDGEHDNGNGSLMRILPLLFPLYQRYGCDLPAHDTAMEQIHLVSALTHAHPRSQLACGIYLTVGAALLEGASPAQAVSLGVAGAAGYYEKSPAFSDALKHFGRLLDVPAFLALPREAIRSSGYVVDTLEAALWCVGTTSSYTDCVLQAVNLGEDTDTVGAVAGGLAGIAYGAAAIPTEWTDCLARLDWIRALCGHLK